jgi:hypothetical protein
VADVESAEGRRLAVLFPVAADRRPPVIAGEDVSGQAFSNRTARFCAYQDCGFKSCGFTDVRFEHCRFERCYFKRAKFGNVSFLDCRFVDCDFDRATFERCNLEYAEFDNCRVVSRQIERCLPDRLNLRTELLRNLRMNAQDRGMAEDVRWYLLQELQASEQHYWKMMFDWDDPYYRERYGVGDRIRASRDWARLTLSKLFWGHGESWLLILRASVVVIILFGLLYGGLGWQIRRTTDLRSSLGLADGIGYSVASFLTVPYGDWVALDAPSRIATLVEAGVGLLMFGFLIAAIYRRISQR